MLRNDKGEFILGIPELAKKEFGTGDRDIHGWPVVRWELVKEAPYAADFGYDNRFKIINVVLAPGMLIVRYGRTDGSFVTEYGTPYEKIGLPYKKETIEYHVYRVVKETTADMIIKGISAAAFDSEGGGVQYMLLKHNVYRLCKEGYIEEVDFYE